MCDYGDSVPVEVLVCAEVGYSECDERKVKQIAIMLRDGRQLHIKHAHPSSVDSGDRTT